MFQQVLRSVDEAIAAHERQKRLLDIYSRTDSKSVGVFKGGRGFKVLSCSWFMQHFELSLHEYAPFNNLHYFVVQF